MNKCISLINFVPVYNYKEKIQQESINHGSCADWVDDRKALGDKGELLVKQYLESQIGAKVYKMPDIAGYDFQVHIDGNITCAEVKTTFAGRQDHFFLSANEINTAKLRGLDYSLYYVRLSNYGGDLYIIKNPFFTIGLNNIIETTHEDDIVSLKVSSVEISILELKAFEKVNDFAVAPSTFEFVEKNKTK